MAYREQATSFGQIAKEHGALSYREFRSDDLGDNLKVEDGPKCSRRPWPSSSHAPTATR